jgi:D-serine ammonia-lyase
LYLQAAAPQPPQVETNESASTASLIDVDLPSVHTVPSDFLEQEIQTETQAKRLERESEAKKAKSKAKKEAVRTDNWLTAQFSKLSDGSAGAIAVANLVGVASLSAWLGYKGWGLYERGNLTWQKVGLGVGILASVGVAESALGRYLYKGQKSGSS